MSRIIACSLIALVATSALAMDTASGQGEITARSVIASMNIYRAQEGLAPLHEDSRLDAAAEDRITDMEDLGYWNHVAPDGRSPFLWLQPRGYLFSNAGENLARGFETTEVLVASWMESEGHRANIMSQRFEDCGVAIIDGSTVGPATGKSIVVLFGRSRDPVPAQKTKARLNSQK